MPKKYSWSSTIMKIKAATCSLKPSKIQRMIINIRVKSLIPFNRKSKLEKMKINLKWKMINTSQWNAFNKIKEKLIKK